MTTQHLVITVLKRAEKLEGKCKYTTNMISRLEKCVLLMADKDLISLAYLSKRSLYCYTILPSKQLCGEKRESINSEME